MNLSEEQIMANANANRDKESKVFDWDEAARIIRERGAACAIAGLQGDLRYTSGWILRDGKPVPQDETYTYLASTWATPVLVIDGEEIPCFKMASQTPWTNDTYWPESAVEILNQ